MSLFSQLHRPFFRHFANRAVKSRIFEWKNTKKLFSPKYRGKVLLGDVAEVAEEIIRETCNERDIEIIDKPFFRKESFTKETIISAKRWKRVYKIFKNSFINNLLEKV